jgi:hypothetical protein
MAGSVQEPQRVSPGIAALQNQLPIFQPPQAVHGSLNKQRKQLRTPQHSNRLDQRLEGRPSTRDRHVAHVQQRPIPPLPPNSPSGIGNRWMRISEPMGEDAYVGGGSSKRYCGFKSDQMQQKLKSDGTGGSHLLTSSSFGSVSKGARRKS